jgi:hypothetical protein
MMTASVERKRWANVHRNFYGKWVWSFTWRGPSITNCSGQIGEEYDTWAECFAVAFNYMRHTV